MKTRNRLLSIGLSLGLLFSGIPVSAEEVWNDGQGEACTVYAAEDEAAYMEEAAEDGDPTGGSVSADTDAIVDMTEAGEETADEVQSSDSQDAEGQTEDAAGFTVESIEEMVSCLSNEEAVQNEGTQSSAAMVTSLNTEGITTEQSYADIAEAVGAWTGAANSTLTLLSDVDLTNTMTISKTGMTLDLNGYKISGTTSIVTVAENSALTITDSSEGKTGKITYTTSGDYCISSKGILTIQDGTITSGADYHAVIYISKGRLTVEGGTIENTGQGYAIKIEPNAVSAEVKAGTISSVGSNGIYNGATLNIAGGTITGKFSGIYNTGSLLITNGTINGVQDSIYNEAGTMKISGNPSMQPQTLCYEEGKIDLREMDPAGWTIQMSSDRYVQKLYIVYSDNDSSSNVLILPSECYAVYKSSKKMDNLSVGDTGTISAEHTWNYTADGASIHCACTETGCKEKEQSFTLVQPENLIYDGTAKKATLEGKIDALTQTPEITYCCEGGCIHAGKHTAQITAGGATASLSFEIGKAAPAYQKPDGLKATAGDTLAQITLPEGFAWTDPTQSVGEAGTRSFIAAYTPADTTNYEIVTGIELSVEVSEKPKNDEPETNPETNPETDPNPGMGNEIPHVHSYGAWKTTSKATVFAPAVQTRTCACGASETQNVGKKLTAVLELPGKLKSLSIKKGAVKTFAVTMANGDSVKSVKSSAAKTLNAVLDKKTGKITLKALKTGTVKLTIKLASSESRTYTVKVTNSTIKTTALSVTSVTNKKLTLAKGKTHTLKTEVKPFTSTQKVTYTSSNKKVATVTSAGKIKAIAAGKATITAKSGSKSVKITVTVPGITIAKTSVSVKKGKILTLSPKTYGISSKVTYASSNKKVATVTSKGKIKGIKKGTAKITVKAGSYTKTVTVKVK